jgi:hypothetical protein
MSKVALLLVAVVLIACSSGGPGSADLGGGGTGTACEKAKKVADDCKASGGDSGVTINFDLAKCESGGAEAEAAAQCIVNNSSNCDCLLPCAIKKSCS